MLTLINDVRYALRQWRAAPWFAAIVAASLALGIGAATAIFSAVNPVLLHPLPYTHPERLVNISYGIVEGTPIAQTFGTFSEVHARSRAFDALAVFKGWQPTLIGSGEPERIDGQRVSAEYFDVLGVRPALGHEFDPADDRVNGPNDVILSDTLWRRRFAADPGIIGRQITLDGALFTVVGVMPRGFESVLAPSAQLWTLLQYDRTLPPDGREWGHHLQMIGRLRGAITIDGARRDLDAIARARVPEFPRQPQASMARGLVVTRLADEVSRDIKPALVAVAAAVLLLLTIACVNVVNLLLARGAQRRGEFAMRVALGAGRKRLVAQVMTESVLLACVGGAGGLAIAYAGARSVVALGPSGIARLSAIAVDRSAFLFAFAVTALVGLVIGIVPALHAWRDDVRSALQGASTRMTGGRETTRRALVVAEVALALVLLVAAGLLLRSLDRLFSIPPGFDPSEVVAMQVQVASAQRLGSDAAMRRFFQAALETVQRTPGVASAAFTTQLPLSGDDAIADVYGVEFERRDADRLDRVEAYRYAVTPTYFETMHIPLRRGRLFDEAAPPAGARPVVISESLAKQVFGGGDPLGQRLRFGGDVNRPWDAVVGVVGDVKQTSLTADDANAVYVDAAHWMWADPAMWLVVRSSGGVAGALTDAVKRAVWSVDKEQPVVRASTMDAVVAASQSKRRFALIAFNVFALAALGLAAIGIYGILATAVVERTREIGIRSALGASRTRVVAFVMRQALVLTVGGAAAGAAGATIATRAIESLLFGITPLDPVTYATGVAILLVVSAVACWAPAYRAARIDPAIALRAE